MNLVHCDSAQFVMSLAFQLQVANLSNLQSKEQYVRIWYIINSKMVAVAYLQCTVGQGIA